MIAKHQFFIVLVISFSLFIENGEAGWKFWKKDKEIPSTTTITTTSASISIQPITTPTKATMLRGPTVPTVNTGTTVIGAANPELAIDANGQNIRNDARSYQPNPGTEVGLDIVVSKPNRPGIGDRNRQIYRDWAVDFTGAGQPVRSQPSKTPAQGPATNGSSFPDATSRSAISNRPDFRPTSISGNMPVQLTQPSIAGSRSGITPQSLPQSTASRPNSIQPVQPVQLHVTPVPTATLPARVDYNSPSTPSNGKTWADVAAGGIHRSASSTSPPKQPKYQALPRAAVAGGGAAAIAGVTAITDHVSDSTKKVYSSNPTYSKGNTVTDEDLEKLSEALYIKEMNNANRYIKVNLQKQTTSSNPTDQASQPLLAVNSEAFQIPTIQRVLSIFDNYQLDTHTNEYISPAQRQEESLLVDTFLSTNVMSVAMRFLADKGFVRQDYYEYKDMLRRIWFNLFSRGQGKIGSTGFEHVFMAETKQIDSGTEILGLHNWIYFNAEETKNHVDYLGYIKKIDLGNKGFIIKMHAKFNGYDKPVVTVFIGTSPELEMALYTVCFLARPDGNCPVSLGGTKFNIITHKFRYRGKDLIGTAYPDI